MIIQTRYRPGLYTIHLPQLSAQKTRCYALLSLRGSDHPAFPLPCVIAMPQVVAHDERSGFRESCGWLRTAQSISFLGPNGQTPPI
jgi:hypothetical protein